MHLLVFLVLCRACVCQMSLLNVTAKVSALIGQSVNITCTVTPNWHTLRIYISNNEQVAFYSKKDNECKNDAENSQDLTDICNLTQRRFGIGFKSIRSERNNTEVKFTLTYNEDTEQKEINKSSRIIIEYGEDIRIIKSGLYNVSENTSFVLPCLKANFELLHKNEVENKNVNQGDFKKISYFEDTATMISNTTCFDTGLYTCKSTNCHGNETLLKFNVSVLCHPYFLSRITKEREVVIGKPIVITVRYTGYPPPKLMLNRTQIHATDIRNESFNLSIHTRGIIHDARICKRHAEYGDHGLYSLEISNCIGKTKVDILIKVISTSFETTIVIGIIVASVICIALVAIAKKFGRQRFYKGIRKLWNRDGNGGLVDGANDDYRDNILYVSVDQLELRSSLEIGNYLFNEIHGQGNHLQIENYQNSDNIDENFDAASARQSSVDNDYQSIHGEVHTSHIDKGTLEQLTEDLGESSRNEESIDTNDSEIDQSELVTRKMCRKPVPLPRRIKEKHC